MQGKNMAAINQNFSIQVNTKEQQLEK